MRTWEQAKQTQTLPFPDTQTNKQTHLIWWDDESEVEKVIVVREVDLTRLWQVQLIDVWESKREQQKPT